MKKKPKLLVEIPAMEKIELWVTINGYQYEIDAITTLCQLTSQPDGRYRLILDVTTKPEQKVRVK